MPTNDERREVAARLRELPDIPSEMGTWEGGLMFIEPSRADEADYSQIHKVLFGCLPADIMHPCDYEELHARLADLIEPEERACRDVYDGREFRCSECGTVSHVLLRDEAMDWRLVTPSYCPNCGAKVIHDA